MHKYQTFLAEVEKANISFDVHPVAPRTPLMNRFASAAPDLAMTTMFIWCWFDPTAWRPTLASELGALMSMEFFALHSAMFLGSTASVQRESIGVKLVTAMIVMVFYIPIAGAFAYFYGGWSAFVGFGWLLLTRVICMLAGQGSSEFESKRMQFYWSTGVVLYFICAFAAPLLPLPQLGIRDATDLFWEKSWIFEPVLVMAWGSLYFGSQAVIKLLEKPEWIEGMQNPARVSPKA